MAYSCCLSLGDFLQKSFITLTTEISLLYRTERSQNLGNWISSEMGEISLESRFVDQ